MNIRVGFIGAGGIAVSHLMGLARLPHVEVVAMSDLTKDQVESAKSRANQRLKDASEKAGDSFGPYNPVTAAAYDSYDDMLRSERLDAVYICLPPFAHGDPEMRAIELGLPMMVEKPVALDLATANRILAQINEREIIAASGYQLRYIPELQQAKNALTGKTIGMVTAMRYGSTPGVPWYHRQDRSGGQLIEMATHEMDLTRFLAGDISRVYAEADTRINNQTNPEYDIFDVNTATMRFENGAVGTFSNNFISKHGAPTHARGLHVMADGVTVSFHLGGPIDIITAEGKQSLELTGNPMFFEDQAFIEAVANGKPELILSTYESGVRTLVTTVAVERSARTGQPVNVQDLLANEVPALS